MSIADILFTDVPDRSGSCKHLRSPAMVTMCSCYINKLLMHSSAHRHVCGEGSIAVTCTARWVAEATDGGNGLQARTDQT
jgi:hypothetical protein